MVTPVSQIGPGPLGRVWLEGLCDEVVPRCSASEAAKEIRLAEAVIATVGQP